MSRLKTVAALTRDAEPSDGPSVRTLGPTTIAEAEAYIEKLTQVEAVGRARMPPTVRHAVERLAAASVTLAETWDT